MSRLVGPAGRVVAVEAVPTTASVLRGNLARNPRAANVTVVEAAIGVEAGEATIFVADRSTGAAGIGKTWDADFTGSTFVLKIQPVRELLDRAVVGAARLVKLDFEGGEMGVAADLIEHGWLRDDCVLLLEVNPRPADGDAAEHDRFHAALAAKGWIVCRYENDYDTAFYRSTEPVRFEVMDGDAGAAGEAAPTARSTSSSAIPMCWGRSHPRRRRARAGGPRWGRRGRRSVGPRLMSADQRQAIASVIVPVRNGAAVIGDLLESLATDGSTTPYELVIADNGSTDATAEVVARFADRFPGLRVIDASARPGAGFARRAGAEAARTDLLLFVDADDTVDPGYVDAMVRGLGTAPYVHACSDTAGLNPPWLHKIYPGLGCVTIATGTWKWALGSTVGIRRDVYDAAGGWSPEIRFSEDADLGFRVRYRTGVEPVPAEGANVHVRLRPEWQASFRQGIGYGTGQSTVNRAWRGHGVDPDTERSVVGRILGCCAASRPFAHPSSATTGASRPASSSAASRPRSSTASPSASGCAGPCRCSTCPSRAPIPSSTATAPCAPESERRLGKRPGLPHDSDHSTSGSSRSLRSIGAPPVQLRSGACVRPVECGRTSELERSPVETPIGRFP